jgi:hypothetical protein
MRHFDPMSVVGGSFADRRSGPVANAVGWKRDAELHETSEAGDLRSLRLANEAALAWAEQATRCAILSDFEISLANMQNLAAAIVAGEMRIAAQEVLLLKMESRRWPTAAAKDLLVTMREIQDAMRQHLERLERQLGSSRN